MQRLGKILDKAFFPGYYFHIPKLVKDDSWKSNIELVSKFVTSTGINHTERIQPSLE
jgi:hypothetical protein